MEWPNFKTFIAFLKDQRTFRKRILERSLEPYHHFWYYHHYRNVYSIGSRYISDPVCEWDELHDLFGIRISYKTSKG